MTGIENHDVVQALAANRSNQPFHIAVLPGTCWCNKHFLNAQGLQTFADSARTGTPVADELQAETGLPVAVENDANALALAERQFGWGRETDDFVCIRRHFDACRTHHIHPSHRLQKQVTPARLNAAAAQRAAQPVL
jgi:ROK family